MGLIKKLLGGLFSFIGGLFGAFGKVLGLGKKSEFFLEAEPSSSAATEPAASPTTTTAAAPAAASATVTTNGKVAEPVKTVAAATPAVTPAPTPAATPAAAAASASNGTFAPNFLLGNSQGSRRRPGPSMNPYLDMAKQVKPR